MSLNKTLIDWVKNPDGSQGYTLNSKTGCLNHTPEGLCLGGMFPCYAYKLANGRLSSLYLSNLNIPDLIGWNDHPYKKEGVAEKLLDPFYPRFWPGRLTELRGLGRGQFGLATIPKGIFLDDMSDWMGDYWPEEWTEQELQMMRDCPQHRIYTLTKQPQNLVKFSPYPPNCWVGVTATDAKMARNALHELLRIEAKVKYISFEPLLERIYIDCAVGIDWVIIGAQTKPYKPPKIEWVEEIVRACDKAGVPVFLKDNLKPMFSKMTPREAVAYGDLNKPYLIEEVSFADNNTLIAHKLRQEMPDGQ